MIFYKVVFALSLLFLFATNAAIVFAVKAGDTRRARVLQFFRLGLGLSACSYLIHIVDRPPTGLLSLASLFFCLAGSLLISVGWMEHWKLFQERQQAGFSPVHGDPVDAPPSEEPGLPPLDSAAGRVLRNAQEEAVRRRQSCVDTDHLLLGLLCEPGCVGTQIIDRLGVKRGSLCQALGQTVAPDRHAPASAASGDLPLTERARRVFALARQEAHRFDGTSVGTDHLLLGLVLMGSGAAAVALFQEGVTVDDIRSEILRGLPNR